MSNKNPLHYYGFHKLGINDRDKLLTFLKSFPQYSDFNYTSMLSWDTEDGIEIRLKDDGLSIVFQDYETAERFLSFLGKHNVDEHLKYLLALSQAYGYGDTLKLIPETVINHMAHKNEFVVKEDRDNFDYVLSVNHLARLAGSKNEDRRRAVKKFLTAAGDNLEVRQLKLNTLHDMKQIMGCLDTWEVLKGSTRQNNALEREAIRRVLLFSNKLNLQSLGFFVKHHMVAFSIFEILDDKNGIVHFEKCYTKYPGLTSYVRHQTAVRFEEEGVTHINYEQDLGISGLRKSKEMLHPVHFLKKYSVKLAT